MIAFTGVIFTSTIALADVAANYKSINENIVQPKCTSCHSDLGTYSGLMGMVTPGNPEASAFYTSVRDGAMPEGGSLSASEVEAIRAWIAAGAANN